MNVSKFDCNQTFLCLRRMTQKLRWRLSDNVPVRLPGGGCRYLSAAGSSEASWHGRMKGDTDRLLRGLSAADGSWTAEGSVLKLKTGPNVLGVARLSFPEASTGRPLFGSADDEEVEMSVCYKKKKKKEKGQIVKWHRRPVPEEVCCVTSQWSLWFWWSTQPKNYVLKSWDLWKTNYTECIMVHCWKQKHHSEHRHFCYSYIPLLMVFTKMARLVVICHEDHLNYSLWWLISFCSSIWPTF